jgi:hypothetical protein
MVLVSWAWCEDVELVAFGVRERDPPDAVDLERALSGCAEGDESVGLGLPVGRGEIGMEAVRALLAVGNLDEQPGDPSRVLV